MNKILGLAAVAVLLLSACGPGDTTDDSLATDTVGQGIETTADNAAEGLDAAGDAVGDSVNAAGDTLAETGENIADAAGDAVDATADAASDAGDAIADTADNAVDATADAAENAGDAIADTADNALDAADNASDELVEETDDALADADAAAEEITDAAVEDADAAITVGEGEVGDALIEVNLPQEVIDAQAGAQEQLIALQDSLAADPEFDASTELESIRNDLEAAYTDAGPEAMAVWDSVSAQFDDLSGELAAGSETATDSLGALVDNLTNITDEARARGAQ